MLNCLLTGVLPSLAGCGATQYLVSFFHRKPEALGDATGKHVAQLHHELARRPVTHAH
nr:hypothetical protein [Nitrosospira sp. Nsp2]